MDFHKKGIALFKASRRYYMTWRKKLTPVRVKDAFYNGDENRSIKKLFPGKNLQYFDSSSYDIVVGDYQRGLKYVDETGTYYMFWSANSFWAYPQSVAVGKVVDGIIYMIREHFPRGEFDLDFLEFPEEHIKNKTKGFKPRSYSHAFFGLPSRMEDITKEDEKCLKIAYEGIRAFSKLIENIQYN